MGERIAVYQATHERACKKETDYMIPIQVGAVFSDKRLQEVSDDEGENISEKNKQYCELTALYWMWKNSDADVLGLCHYRRIFSFKKAEQIGDILKEYNVITPRPYCFRTNLEEEYAGFHNRKDMQILKDILHQKRDGSYEALRQILENNRLYPYNMMIMKRRDLEQYCEWIFGILWEVEQRRKGAVTRTPYQERYIGFLGERLFTAYLKMKRFEHYEDDIVYEEKGYREKVKWHSAVNDGIFQMKRKWIKR